MTEKSSDPPPEKTDDDAETGDEAVPHRRLIDKINAAVLHALDQGRREIAAKLKLVHEALIEQEIAEGYEDRSDDDLNKWLDRRYKSDKAIQKIRPRRY